MASAPLRMTALAVATLILTATRFPGESVWAIVALVGGALTIAMAALSLTRRAPIGSGTAVFLLCLLLLLVPTSNKAWLAVLPDWAVAVPMAFALHTFFLVAGDQAPVLGNSTMNFWAKTLRFLPATLAIVLLFTLPLTWQWILPTRINAVHELQGAMQPLTALVMLGIPIVVVGLLRATLGGKTSNNETDENSTHPKVEVDAT